MLLRITLQKNGIPYSVCYGNNLWAIVVFCDIYNSLFSNSDRSAQGTTDEQTPMTEPAAFEPSRPGHPVDISDYGMTFKISVTNNEYGHKWIVVR